MLARLFRFRGGIKPASNKTLSNAAPIATAPLPPRLVVPLHQSIGGTPRPLVKAGDRVLKGQKIGEADGFISSAVHAPTSGIVRAVDMAVQPHVSGLSALSVTIDSDGEDRWSERVPLDLGALSPAEVQARLQQAGVVGLGGAAFPSHAKLAATPSVAMDELIINGAECEPYITCDDRLMRERAPDIVRGTVLFRDLLQPKRTVIAIEDNKPEAISAMREAVAAVGEAIEVIAVPSLYPAGGAKQLIRVITGKAIPGTIKRTTDLGVQCFNVATTYAAWRAAAHGEPLLGRVLTLTGNVRRPGNHEVLVGTPIDDLLKLAEPLADTDGFIMGGPMMGFRVATTAAPVVKATNCLIAGSPALFPPKAPEMPCIRCGECAKVCPHELRPYEMYWWAHAKNFGKAQEYELLECIECGCCTYVCPSRIPLVHYFRFAKSEIWARERDRLASEGAKERFDFKNEREEREKREKAEKLARAAAAQKAKAEAAANAAAAGEAPVDPEAAAKKALIAAAMERAKAQREAAAAAASGGPVAVQTSAPSAVAEIAAPVKSAEKN